MSQFSAVYYRDLYDKMSFIMNRDILCAQDSMISNSKNSYYKYIEKATKVPWWMIGSIHMRECDFNFTLNIRDGTPLHEGESFVGEAIKIFQKPEYQVKEWNLETVLLKCEIYNGLGYQLYHPTVLSPYLWSMSNLYSKGKYDRDGHFNPDLIDEQVGIAVLLKSLENKIEFTRI